MSQICFQFLVSHLRPSLGSCHFVLKARGNSNSMSFLSCFKGFLSPHNMSWKRGKREDCKYRYGFNPLLGLNPVSSRGCENMSWLPGAAHKRISPHALSTSCKPAVPVSSWCAPSLSRSPSNSTHTCQETQTSSPLFIDPGVSSRWQQEESRLLCVCACVSTRETERIFGLLYAQILD